MGESLTPRHIKNNKKVKKKTALNTTLSDNQQKTVHKSP